MFSVPLVGSISLEVPANYIITLAVVIPMKTVMERPIREVDQRSYCDPGGVATGGGACRGFCFLLWFPWSVG